jgi:hypothetical protein
MRETFLVACTIAILFVATGCTQHESEGDSSAEISSRDPAPFAPAASNAPKPDPTPERYLADAEAGNAEAQYQMGLVYNQGRVVAQDFGESLKWWRLAAEQGHVGALMLVGISYYKGLGVPPDLAEAVRWYRRAAEQGSADAQSIVGSMYGDGNGIPQDHTEAAKWWQLAAEQGHPGAQNRLGAAYLNGRGVQQNYAQAVKWLTGAAEQGEVNAQYNLGNVYASGKEGLPLDLVQAHKWMNLAATERPEWARERDDIASKMSTEQIAEAQRLAREWSPKTGPAKE